jgi:probable HAF family extracellular repeat protein
MNSRISGMFAAMFAIAAVMAVPRTPAQDAKREHPRYVVRDLGTFGGPQSHFFSAPVVESVNNRGTVVGGADTPLPDPTCFVDCHVLHAFEWKRGVLTDLGTLPGGANSMAFWINERGLILGLSETGVIDPLTGVPEQVAVIWKDGQIKSLGTLGGGNFSFPNAMNNDGQVVGLAQNTIPDPFSLLGLGTQSRAFLWQEGVMLDLGDLGGPDSWAASINAYGDVAGWSFTDSSPNPSTKIPTTHPFLWQDGTMHDLGTLGGNFAVVGSLQSPGAGASLNNRGQVIGTSNLAGDLIHHPFLWDDGALTDLGTLGGNNGEAWWINNEGEIVGRADLPDSQVHHAFLWKNGKMIDLGAAPGQPCSTAIDINSRGQIIIDTGFCVGGGGPGMLWENGKLYDLNTLISLNPVLAVGDVSFINDRGEIAATGVLANGDQHAILLVPCDQDHSGLEGCDDDRVEAVTETPTRPAKTAKASAATAANANLSPAEIITRFHSMMVRRYPK